jgi:uncharacterized membrane protein YdjX (TVP38/TMEM64 family)
MRKFDGKFKFLLGACMIAIFIIGAKQLNFHEVLQNALQATLVWIKDQGPVGVLAYIVIYNLAAILFIPGSLLTLGGGAIYGVFWGSVYVFTAATLGATLAFLLGRYVAQGWVNQRIEGNTKFRAIAQAVAQDGFKIVFLTRLSPIFPFNLLNYAFGVTQVSLRDYVLGSIGMLPGTITYVYLGFLIGDIAALAGKRERTTAEWILYGIGLVVTLVISIYITRIARNALSQSVSDAATSDASSQEPEL